MSRGDEDPLSFEAGEAGSGTEQLELVELREIQELVEEGRLRCHYPMAIMDEPDHHNIDTDAHAHPVKTVPLSHQDGILSSSSSEILSSHVHVPFTEQMSELHSEHFNLSPPTSSSSDLPSQKNESNSDTCSSSCSFPFRKIFRYLNVATVSFCMLSSLLRPMEERIQRRAEPSSSRRLPMGIEFGSTISTVSDAIWDRFLADNNNDNYYNGDKNGNENENDNNQKENGYYYDNNNINNNGNDDDQQQVADGDDLYAYFNVSNYTYYNISDTNNTYYEEEEEEEYYYAPIDDFYNFIDDDWEERKVFPMDISDYVGFICVALSIILSIGGGIGPGAILVAVYIIVMDFPPKVAIPLSCVTGLGVNTTGNILNARKRHPLSNRPIIDWDLILVMEPVILLGAIIGTYLNKMLQGKILVVLLVLLLSVIAHSTLKKARRMHHAEELYIKRIMWAKQKRLNVQAHSTAPVYPASFDNKLAEADPPFMPKIHSMSGDVRSISSRDVRSVSSRVTPGSRRKGGKRRPLLADQSDKSVDDNSRSDGSSFSNSFNSFIVLRKEDAESVKSSLVEEDAEPLPQHKITYIIAMFLFVIGMNIFKGGIAFESPLGVTCGSIGFWLFEFMTACWLILCTMLAGRYLLRRHAIKEAVGYDYVRGDIKWDVRNVVIYPSACLISGVLSGMFGIGVAVFVGPMLVGIGVNPAVASATCACMNFFTALAAVSSYVVLGSLVPDREYAVFLYILGAVSGLLGVIFTQKARSTTKIENNKRLERHSYMAYSMGIVVLVSALCMTLEALLDVINHSFDDDEVDGVCQMERMS